MKNGYLTVYLSLTLTIILSFILTLVEGARINTMKLSLECAADIGMNSVLAEFHRELLEQYDLLFVDMSYGRESGDIDRTREHLRKFLSKNFGKTQGGWGHTRDWLSLYVNHVEIPAYTLASDEDGNVMRRQALIYMKGSSLAGALVEIMDYGKQIEDLGISSRDVTGERNAVKNQIDSIERPKKVNEDGTEEEIPLENPADRVDEYRGFGILNLVLDDVSLLSSSSVIQEQYLSNRNKNQGSGWADGRKIENSPAEKILYGEYLFRKMGRYGKTLDKSLLQYQLEYLLSGGGSDWENLEKTAEKLLLWREAANITYLFSDQTKCAQARTAALALTAVAQVPALVEPVKISILFAWAYLESIHDVKTLLKGGRVPILKTSADWKTDLNMVTNFSGNTVQAESEGNGLSYDDYLRIMLFLQDDVTLNFRAMDIMEMDIRKTAGNSRFQMDACFDYFTAQIAVGSEFGYSFTIEKKYGYD